MDPLRYLRVGVVPSEEAELLAESLESEGYAVERVVTTDEVAVLSARRAADGASAVRVVTRNGAAVGLDAPDRAHPARTAVWALPEPLSGRDIDGDGSVDIVIAVAEQTRPGACFGVLRIDEHGRAFERPVRTRWVQEGACAEDVRDVGGDARPELLVVGRYALYGALGTPTVAIPFRGHEGRFVPMGPEAGRFYAGATRARENAAEHARQRGDMDAAAVAGVEAGLLALFAGHPVSEAVATMERVGEGASVDALAEGRRLLGERAAVMDAERARAEAESATVTDGTEAEEAADAVEPGRDSAAESE